MNQPLSTRSAAPFILVLGLALLSVAASGCGVLIGNIKPEDEKSQTYGVADLSKESSDWTRLDPSKAGNGATDQDPQVTPTEVSDAAYQSKKTASVVSLNSACRSPGDTQIAPPASTEPGSHADLQHLTDLLFLGISDISERDEKDLSVQSTPALETTLQGKVNADAVKIRTVVLRRKSCVYDLMYIAKPDQFEIDAPEFSHFIASLRLK